MIAYKSNTAEELLEYDQKNYMAIPQENPCDVANFILPNLLQT